LLKNEGQDKNNCPVFDAKSTNMDRTMGYIEERCNREMFWLIEETMGYVKKSVILSH
jgi:hypothetical protein